jgi:hypothetical protein
LIFKLIPSAIKPSQKTARTASAVPATVKKQIAQLQPPVAQTTPKTIKRQSLKNIYEQQKKIVTKHLEMPTYTPYVVLQTTVLGNYLSKQDWQDVATQQIDERDLLQRIENSFDKDLHGRLTRTAQQVGFINVRRQIPTGVQQFATYSDGEGHGVKIAIRHEDETQIGIDLLGYQGNDCHTKREELIKALAEEGIELAEPKFIHHDDPDGYKVKQKAMKQPLQQRRQQRRQKQRH